MQKLLLVLCFFLLVAAVASEKCPGGTCKEKQKCEESLISDVGTAFCKLHTVCCLKKKSEGSRFRPGFLKSSKKPKEESAVATAATQSGSPASSPGAPLAQEPEMFGRLLVPSEPGQPKPVLVIDGNDETFRSWQLTHPDQQFVKFVDVVGLDHFNFDKVQADVNRLGHAPYRVVIFTMHGRNGGRPTPSVPAVAKKLPNGELELTKEELHYRGQKTHVSNTAVVNPLVLSLNSRKDFQSAAPGTTKILHVDYLKGLYELVRNWNPRPVVILFVCNNLEGNSKKPDRLPHQPRPGGATNIPVFFPPPGCSSYRPLNWDVLNEHVDENLDPLALAQDLVGKHKDPLGIGKGTLEFFQQADFAELVDDAVIE